MTFVSQFKSFAFNMFALAESCLGKSIVNMCCSYSFERQLP